MSYDPPRFTRLTMGYFAFVRRDGSRRYHATVPDFPGCRAEADRLDGLADAVRAAVRSHAHSGNWPAPTSLEKLPKQESDHDGYWLVVEVDIATD